MGETGDMGLLEPQRLISGRFSKLGDVSLFPSVLEQVVFQSLTRYYEFIWGQESFVLCVIISVF